MDDASASFCIELSGDSSEPGNPGWPQRTARRRGRSYRLHPAPSCYQKGFIWWKTAN